MLRQSLLLSLSLLMASTSLAHAAPFTDAGGRTVEVPATITKVLPANEPAAVLLYMLAPDLLAGWVHDPSAGDRAFLTPAAAGLPTLGSLTDAAGKADMAVVDAAKPDLIVAVGPVTAADVAQANALQEQTGIPYILINGSFAETAATFGLLGGLLNVVERADQLTNHAETTMSELTTGLSSVPEAERVRVYYAAGADGLETGGAGAADVELLAAVATNVAASAGGVTTVTLKQVEDWAPGYIIAADPAVAAAIKANVDWASIPAVANGMVYTAPLQPFGWFAAPAGANRLIGVPWLENLFYPTAFDNDLKADITEFYKLFYQVDVTDAQIATLLDGAMPKP